MKLPNLGSSIWKRVVCNRLIVSLLAVLGALSGLVWWCGWDWLTTVWWFSWKWLRTDSSNLESGTTTIRNVGLVIGGGIAIWVAYWRSVISQRRLMNERYQKGAEMLGSEVLAVRLGGIYALQHLAEDEPKQYHVQIMRLLCAFVRNPTKEGADTGLSHYRVRGDVQAAMMAIGSRGDADVELEKKEKFELDLIFAELFETGATGMNDEDIDPCLLVGVNLIGANLSKANAAGACLTGAKLIGANLTEAYLTGAYLTSAHLTGARLIGANLSRANLVGAYPTFANFTDANLTDANLTGALLIGAKGLTQEQLDQACADPNNPPDLDGLRDAETDLPLEWRGKPCSK